MDVGGTECPCGGTHVKNVADIKGLTVTKIKKVSLYFVFYLYILANCMYLQSKKNVRVSYIVSDE